MEPSLNIPNQSGLELEVIAWTGDFRSDTVKCYICRSERVQVDPKVYSPEAKAKLERAIAWEIVQTSPPPAREHPKKSWELVRRARFNMHFPETENFWWHIHSVIREDFKIRSQVQMQVRFIDTKSSSI